MLNGNSSGCFPFVAIWEKRLMPRPLDSKSQLVSMRSGYWKFYSTALKCHLCSRCCDRILKEKQGVGHYGEVNKDCRKWCWKITPDFPLGESLSLHSYPLNLFLAKTKDTLSSISKTMAANMTSFFPQDNLPLPPKQWQETSFFLQQPRHSYSQIFSPLGHDLLLMLWSEGKLFHGK